MADDSAARRDAQVYVLARLALECQETRHELQVRGADADALMKLLDMEQRLWALVVSILAEEY